MIPAADSGNVPHRAAPVGHGAPPKTGNPARGRGDTGSVIGEAPRHAACEGDARMTPRTLRLALALVAVLPSLAACAPRVFSDGTVLTIAATPVAAPVRAAVPTRIELREKVQFARDSDRILEVSHAILDEAVAEILAEPRIRKIRVEGHASADGNDAHNLELSTRRAQAVRRYLTEHGVAEAVLVAEGFGESKPIADNGTEDGRESNRRVELHVIETDEGAGGSSESTP